MSESFFKSCADGDIEAVTKYVSSYDPYVKDGHGRTGLIYAIYGGRLNVIKYLMETCPGLHLERTSSETSAIQIAIFSGYPKDNHSSSAYNIIKELIKVHSNDNVQIIQRTKEMASRTYGCLPEPVELTLCNNIKELLLEKINASN
jgi:hypothetical protein